jgi:hypothetical protein
MSTTNQDQSLRGAVALNNIGVTLLERHCYKSAMLTFKDSVQLLKHALQEIDSTSDVSNKIQRAMCHLSHSFQISCQLAVLSVDVISSEALESASRKSTRFSRLSVVRLDDVDSAMESAFLTAVMLYNLSNSYLCLKKAQCPCPSGIVDLSHTAVTLLCASHNILRQLKDTVDDQLQMRLLHLEVLVLGTLVPSMNTYRGTKAAPTFCLDTSYYTKQYNRLCMIMQKLEGIDELFSLADSAAPAA